MNVSEQIRALLDQALSLDPNDPNYSDKYSGFIVRACLLQIENPALCQKIANHFGVQ